MSEWCSVCRRKRPSTIVNWEDSKGCNVHVSLLHFPLKISFSILGQWWVVSWAYWVIHLGATFFKTLLISKLCVLTYPSMKWGSWLYCFMGTLWSLNELTQVKHLDKCLTLVALHVLIAQSRPLIATWIRLIPMDRL